MSSPAATATVAHVPAGSAAACAAPARPRGAALLDSLAPLLMDVAVPLAAYYALKAAGASTFAALAWSSAVPAVRVIRGALRERRLNGLAALMVTVNAIALLTGLVVGDGG